MQLADREIAQISKHITDAEALLGVLPQKPSQITAELGLGVVRSALFALDESASDALRAARALQKLRLALATLNVPSEVHEHVREAFKVLGTRQEEALRQLEISCLVAEQYRKQSLKAELQGVRAELAGEDPAAALEPARRAQMIVDELGERLRPTLPSGRAKSPLEAVAELVQILGG
jgi:type II secretory pathway component PulK